MNANGDQGGRGLLGGSGLGKSPGELEAELACREGVEGVFVERRKFFDNSFYKVGICKRVGIPTLFQAVREEPR